MIAFVRGDDSFVIPLPRPQPYQIKLVNCDTHFALSYKKNQMSLIFKNFRYGVRNSAIKQIFRMYLERPNFQVFYDDPIYVTKARGKKKKTFLPLIKSKMLNLFHPLIRTVSKSN